MNKMVINTYLLIINLNVNGLNAPIKRHKVSVWILKKRPIYTLPTHFRPKDTCKLKVREWKKIFHGSGNEKKAGVVTLVSDKN